MKNKDVFRKKIQYLIDRKETFEVVEVNGNYSLKSDLFKEKHFRRGIYTQKELVFIGKVKRHVKKSNVALDPLFRQQVLPDHVSYIDVHIQKEGKVFDNVVEIDLDEAYWQTARILGIISEELYQQGKKGTIGKQARMTALGTLAKKSRVFKYKDGKGNLEVVSDPLLENLWFTICKRISDVMQKAVKALGKDFIFYWVDGIYLVNTPENVKKVEQIFHESGYSTKYKEIITVSFNEKGFVCQDTETKQRPFNYPHYKTKKKALSYLESIELSNFFNQVLSSNEDITSRIERIAEKRINRNDNL